MYGAEDVRSAEFGESRLDVEAEYGCVFVGVDTCLDVFVQVFRAPWCCEGILVWFDGAGDLSCHCV